MDIRHEIYVRITELLPDGKPEWRGLLALLRDEPNPDVPYIALDDGSGLVDWVELSTADHTHPGGGSTVTVSEGGTPVDAAAGTINLDASDFNVTSSPAGTANVSLAYGTGAGTPAEGNHAHANDHVAATVLDTASINMTLAGQQISADAIFGTTATTIAQGNHSHANDHVPVTVSDTASIDLTLSGQQVSAAAIFGTTGTTVAVGNHTHVGGGTTITVQEGDTTIEAAADTLDFNGDSFNVSLSPAGEANINLNYGLMAGTPAEGNHDHTGTYSPVGHTHDTGVSVEFGDAPLASDITILDFDADGFAMSESGGEVEIGLNFGTDPGSVAEGDHVHANDHVPVTVTDTASINLSLTGQDVSAAAIFGTGAGTVAEGNHTHAGGGTLDVEFGDLALATNVSVIDFDADGFALSESPAGEVNVGFNFGTDPGSVAEGNHTHASLYAPIGSKYIVQTADATLTGEQALGALATGIVKNTTTTGVLSIAAAGTDYAAPTSGTSILKGNGSGGFSAAVAGTDYALSMDNLSDAAVSSLAAGQVIASANGTSFANLTLITATLGPFFTFNTAGSTSVQMGLLEPTASGTQVVTIADYYAGLAGRVVGMYLNSNADWTAGTATGRVYLDGVVQTFASGACVLSTTNRRRHSAFVSFANGLAFTAGQRIGMGVTTASWTPTTADFHGLLVVMYTPF